MAYVASARRVCARYTHNQWDRQVAAVRRSVKELRDARDEFGLARRRVIERLDALKALLGDTRDDRELGDISSELYRAGLALEGRDPRTTSSPHAG